MVREGNEKSYFLCGHDERHWFVAGIPEKAPVGTVRQAKEALKPPLQALVGYCNYAVIYRRSPVGLPVPNVLKRAKLGEQ